MNYQSKQMLDYYAATYGNLFFDIAFAALSNAASVLNCEKPVSRSGIALPDGITRFANDMTIEYCCRAKLLPGFNAPYAGAAKQITMEFNAVAVSMGIDERFDVFCEPYPSDSGYIMIVAKPR